jgi:hypothetical protein
MAIDKDIDWVMGRCEWDKYKKNQMDTFVHYPRLKKKVLERGLQAAEHSKADKPLIILMVSVDSFSRRHFYRKLPNTVNFLNELKAKGQYAIFDHKLHNI